MALAEIIAGFSGLKGRLLLFAGIIVLGGMAWNGASGFYKNGGVPIIQGPSVKGKDWTQGPSVAGTVVRKGDRFSQAMIGVGLSFMIAMIAASVLRAALKTGITLLLIGGLAVWFLDSRGYVNWWSTYLETAKAGGTWINGHVAALRELMHTHLPSASAALIGFGFGLRR